MKSAVYWRNKYFSVGMIIFLMLFAVGCSPSGWGHESHGVAPIITSADNMVFTVGAAGTFTVTATGNPIPSLTLTGTLPSGVTFDTATGVLSGTPAVGTDGTYPLIITASNGVSPAATQNFTLTIYTEALTFLAYPVDDTEVWIMGTDGSGKVMLADSADGEVVQQTMSPDGRTLVYVLHNLTGQMVSKDLNTGVVTVLVDDIDTGFDPTPSYSYDGTKIAYNMSDSDSEDGIRVMNADGTNIQVLTTTENDVSPAFNRSGDRIVFDRGWNGDIYVMNADGSGLAQVKAAGGGFIYGQPQFLPDGRIVYMRRADVSPYNQDIMIMNADGSNEINLTPGTDSTKEFSPTVNLAGDKIAFATTRNASGNDVYVGTLSGDALIDLQNLTADVDYDCWRPRFGAAPQLPSK